MSAKLKSLQKIAVGERKLNISKVNDWLNVKSKVNE